MPPRVLSSVVALLALLSVHLSAQEQAGAVTGVVLSHDTGAPLAGAFVECAALGLSTTTDAHGRFRLAGFTIGRHEVVVTAPGHARQAVSFGIIAPAYERDLETLELHTAPLELWLAYNFEARLLSDDEGRARPFERELRGAFEIHRVGDDVEGIVQREGGRQCHFSNLKVFARSLPLTCDDFTVSLRFIEKGRIEGKVARRIEIERVVRECERRDASGNCVAWNSRRQIVPGWARGRMILKPIGSE